MPAQLLGQEDTAAKNIGGGVAAEVGDLVCVASGAPHRAHGDVIGQDVEGAATDVQRRIAAAAHCQPAADVGGAPGNGQGSVATCGGAEPGFTGDVERAGAQIDRAIAAGPIPKTKTRNRTAAYANGATCDGEQAIARGVAHQDLSSGGVVIVRKTDFAPIDSQTSGMSAVIGSEGQSAGAGFGEGAGAGNAAADRQGICACVVPCLVLSQNNIGIDRGPGRPAGYINSDIPGAGSGQR